jgi:hypothetical protein
VEFHDQSSFQISLKALSLRQNGQDEANQGSSQILSRYVSEATDRVSSEKVRSLAECKFIPKAPESCVDIQWIAYPANQEIRQQHVVSRIAAKHSKQPKTQKSNH